MTVIGTRWRALYTKLDQLAYGQTHTEPMDTFAGGIKWKQLAWRYSTMRGRTVRSHEVDGGVLFVRTDRAFAAAPAAASPARDHTRDTPAAVCGHQAEDACPAP